jgi:hypothetical protein
MSRYNNFENESWMTEEPPLTKEEKVELFGTSSQPQSPPPPPTRRNTPPISSSPFSGSQRIGRFLVSSQPTYVPKPLPPPPPSYYKNKPRGLSRKANMNMSNGYVPRFEFYEYDIENYTYENQARFGNFKKREGTNQNHEGIVAQVNHPTSGSIYHLMESSVDPLVSTNEHIKNIPDRIHQLEIMNYYKKYKNWHTRLSNAELPTIKPFYSTERKEHIINIVRQAFEIQLEYVRQFVPDPLSKTNLNEKSFIYQIKLEPGERLILFGDFHGSLHTFIRHLFRLYLLGVINLENYQIAEGYRIVFLGDLIDRGNYGIDIIYLISKIMIANNTMDRLKCILNRGNHEDRQIASVYGFVKELNQKNIEQATKEYIFRLFELCSSAIVFNCGTTKYWCCHGGIPIEYQLSKRIFNIPTLQEGDVNRNYAFLIEDINISMQIRWNDFSSNRGIFTSSRGPDIYEVGTEYLENFMMINGIDFIVRGHQDSMYNSTILCNSGKIRNNIGKSASKFKDEQRKLSLPTDWYNLSKVPINPSIPIPNEDEILFERNPQINEFFHKIPFETILPNYRVNGSIARIDTYSGRFQNLNGLVKNINSGAYEFYPIVTISTNTDNGRPFTKDSFALLRLDGDDGTSLFTKEYIMRSEFLLNTILGPDQAGGKKKKKRTKTIKKKKRSTSKSKKEKK